MVGLELLRDQAITRVGSGGAIESNRGTVISTFGEVLPGGGLQPVSLVHCCRRFPQQSIDRQRDGLRLTQPDRRDMATVASSVGCILHAIPV